MNFSYTKNMESDFFYKETKPYQKIFKKSGRWEGKGWGVARVSYFFSFFKRIQV